MDETDASLCFRKALVYKCKVCSYITTTKCAACDTEPYCSKKCQIQDWAIHKHKCIPGSENKASSFPCFLYTQPANEGDYGVANGHICFTCHRNAKKHCAMCDGMHYCSSICQRQDWARHKLECLPSSKQRYVNGYNSNKIWKRVVRKYPFLLRHIFRQHSFNPSNEWVLLFYYDPREPNYRVVFRYTTISGVNEKIPVRVRKMLTKNILLHPEQLNILSFFLPRSPIQTMGECTLYCYSEPPYDLQVITKQNMLNPTLTSVILTR